MKGKLLVLVLILTLAGTVFIQAKINNYEPIEPYKPVQKPIEKPVKVAPKKTTPKPKPVQPKPAPKPIYASHAVLNMVNQARVNVGLSRLYESSVLNQSAFLKSQDMVKRNYWGHSPDIKVFFYQAGSNFTYMGENLARCFSSFSAALNGWLNSSTHRAVMMDTRYTHFGIGIVYNPRDNCNYITNHFGG